MARDRFLISLALALAIHALALLVVELLIRNQRARLPEYSGPLFVLLEEVPVIARSLPAAPTPAGEPAPVERVRVEEAVRPREARPRVTPPPAAPPAGGRAPGLSEPEAVKPAPVEPLAAPVVPRAAPPPAKRSEPFVPEEVVIPPAGSGEAAETAGAAGEAPRAEPPPAAAVPLAELDSALRERRDADAPVTAGRGSESGAGPARTEEAAAEPAGDGFLIQWEDPSQGREATSRPLPVLPAWVSREGLRLGTTVSFVLTPEGFLTEVKIEEGSGYSDVDAAVLEALRRWKFKPVAGTRSVRGRVSYIIRPG